MNNIPKKINKNKLHQETVSYIESHYKEYRYSRMIPLQLLLDVLNNKISDNQINTYTKEY